MNAKIGYGGSITSIVDEKVLDDIGERNVYGVDCMITTRMLIKELVTYG